MSFLKHGIQSVDWESRVMGCWLGKAIGGTLGGPHEGHQGPLKLTFYDPVPTSCLPNDDLDLQVVWLCYLLNNGCKEVTPDLLADAWNKHVVFPWDEYGICHRNGAYGLKDHRLGSVDNFFSECMGAAIRSELWACVAPGDPQRAAAFAWADAACDHAGDGIGAEVFFAAVESAAFVESNRDKLIDLGLSFLPANSRAKDAIQLTRAAWARKHDWLAVRGDILAAYENPNFSDVAANLAFTILGWLAGQGDFEKSICIANNCGMDTDCTAATLGSILGILNPNAIPETWRKPIGDGVVLNPQIVHLANIPKNLSELTSLTLRLGAQLAEAKPIIKEIAPRAPQSADDKRLQIPVEIGFSERNALDSDKVPESLEPKVATILPGHWIRREAKDFHAPVMLLHYTFVLKQDEAVQFAAWSQTKTKVWVDGMAATPVEADAVCSRRSNEGAPSFHRGGHGHFIVNGPLKAGTHTFVVAWEWPQFQADLVVGVANAESKQWLPFALLKP
ncbi:MAG: ADP-ribosylglycohydrolase family protein [Chthoniobacteraceae bacterium]